MPIRLHDYAGPFNQKVVYNRDGSASTERVATIGPEKDNRYRNIPTIQQNLGIPLTIAQAVTANRIGQNPEIGTYKTLAEAIAAEVERHKAFNGFPDIKPSRFVLGLNMGAPGRNPLDKYLGL